MHPACLAELKGTPDDSRSRRGEYMHKQKRASIYLTRGFIYLCIGLFPARLLVRVYRVLCARAARAMLVTQPPSQVSAVNPRLPPRSRPRST